MKIIKSFLLVFFLLLFLGLGSKMVASSIKQYHKRIEINEVISNKLEKESKEQLKKETALDKKLEENNLILTPKIKELSFERQEFITKILPDTIKLSKKYKIFPSVMLAQVLLESSYGESDLASKFHNLFGVKDTGEYPSVQLETTEVIDGVSYTVMEDFTNYPHYLESLEYYAKMIGEGKTFKNARKPIAKNYKEASQGIVDGHYATDPNYNEKINDVIESFDLDYYDN